jgi:hypothetical protein
MFCGAQLRAARLIYGATARYGRCTGVRAKTRLIAAVGLPMFRGLVDRVGRCGCARMGFVCARNITARSSSA